jgi:hypothetical protein
LGTRRDDASRPVEAQVKFRDYDDHVRLFSKTAAGRPTA